MPSRLRLFPILAALSALWLSGCDSGGGSGHASVRLVNLSQGYTSLDLYANAADDETDQQRAAVSIVERELLTPVGLRTLKRGDPGYQPRYEGSPDQRDGSYHQGTVWAWLIGPFVDAYRTTDSRDARTEEQRRRPRAIEPVPQRLGLRQVDGIPPAESDLADLAPYRALPERRPAAAEAVLEGTTAPDVP